MDRLEEMLVRNGLIYHGADGDSYVQGSILSNSMVICDKSGQVTHRVERAANGVDVVVRNVSTRTVEATLRVA
jgi:hypothetical protein